MECNYCKENLKIPKKYFNNIFNHIKTKKNKKILYYFILLNISFKNLKKYNINIPFYNEKFLEYIRLCVNNTYYDVDYIKCNYCDRHACPTHFLWSNFKNLKCENCNKFISICGWCDKEKLCINCYEQTNYPLNF
jgi:hypothetical protein